MKIQGRYAAIAVVCTMLIPLAGLAADARGDALGEPAPASAAARPADALEPVVPDDVQKTYASEIARLRDTVSSAEARQVLADGVITQDELAGLTAGYTQCLASKGIRWTEPAEPVYAAKADYNTLPTGPVVKNADGTFTGNEEVKACSDRYGYDEVFGLYDDMRANPAKTAWE
ncbi:hypothetical protein [Bifidobacterium platyrrhinorum]|uniref:Uncharacterized protein n=1 Tax=Bifidobacterium platyrrhinorum TaxID=2661628 RepID=A0A6L9STR2_9BIFI|nr:hypothetical protein [Bifidobacterium platyrrhinorum]NEG55988.1 hypothetical protein [Bifidobacterium platyrrhinorum]